VLAVDSVASRLAAAESFGAVSVDFEQADPSIVARERTGGRGADAAIEAVGSAAATRTAAGMLRHGGRIGALGVHTEEHLAISPGELYDRNLRYSAGRCPARHYMPASLELAMRHVERVDSLISHRLPLEQGVDAYRRFADREAGWNKVVLLPDA
jgi:threonine dehydrogenase-like Zn-dependent dehydrogenase